MRTCLIILSLTFNASFAFAEEIKVTGDEEKILHKIGLTSEDVNSDNQEATKEKLRQKIEAELKPKIEEIKTKLNQESDKVKNSAKELAFGYIASTISLLMATLIGPQVIIACAPRPSAIIYAGTAAVYILSEMLLIKSFKASQLGEVTLVTNFDVDQNKNIKENVGDLINKTHAQMNYFREYKKTLDDALGAIKKKASNAKLVSFGFMAASAAAIAEQMDWITGGGVCVGPVTSIDIKRPNINKIVFNAEIDNQYAKFITDAKTNHEKWALYQEWEDYKFGKNNSSKLIIPTQYTSLKEMDNSFLSNILNSTIKGLQKTIISSAFAAETNIETKKQTVASGLKDNKMADFAGDLDKLGIAAGAAVHLMAYYMGWKLGFLTSIINSGTARAITFGAQAAIAMLVAKLFDKSASEIIDHLNKIDRLISQVENGLTDGLNALVLSDQDSRSIQAFGSKVGVPSSKLVTEMNQAELTTYLKYIKEKVNQKTNEDKKEFNKIIDTIKSKTKDIDFKKTIDEKLKDPTSFNLRNIFNLLINSAHAYDYSCLGSKRCPRIEFAKMDHPSLKNLNVYSFELEKSLNYSITGNQKEFEKSFKFLEKNSDAFANYRNDLYKAYADSKKQDTNFETQKNLKVEQQLSHIKNYLKKLPENDRLLFEKNFGFNNSPSTAQKLNTDEVKSLQGLLSRMNNRKNETGRISSINRSTPSATQAVPKEAAVDRYDIPLDSIHDKNENIFETIHRKYIDKLDQLIKY